MNAAQAEDMVACARARGLFLMEGMWSRFFPAAARVRELVRDGAIGEVRLVQADFGFRCAWDPEGRALNPALGGGALLDVGVYVIAFAQMVFGREPQQIRSMAHLGETGVDEQAGLLLGYDGGGMAVLTCAVQTNTVHDAMIYGTEGHIRIHAPFWQPSRITVQAAGEHEEIEFPHPEGGGFVYEAEAVMACLRAGACECDVMPLDETVLIARIMDRALEQWGLVYP
jgi:predicted dehydrogenase